jgi:DNA anti-recombination protein RmuC
LAIGTSLPGLTGFLFDLDMSRIGPGFLNDVAKALTPGKAAVLAEVEEGSTTRVDARLRRHGGMVFRRLPAEVIETQLIRQSAAFKAKLKTLTRELKRALAWNRAAIQKDIEQVRKQLNETQDQSNARRDQANAEMGAKRKVLQDQAKGAGDRARARIERRISDLKKNFDLHSKKLSKASVR